MSNFPPGVTGNEPQIRGMDEGVLMRECHKDVRLYVFPVGERAMLNGIFSMIEGLREKEALRQKQGSKAYTVKELENSRKYILSQVEQLGKFLAGYRDEELITYTDDCAFVGEVDVQFGDFYLYWECPICGAEHEEEIEDLRP